MVDASRPQAGLGNSKTAAFLSQQIAHGDAHVLEEHLAVAFIVYIAHYWQVAHNGHARRIFRHEYHTLLAVPGSNIGKGFAHHNQEFASFAGSSLILPLATVSNRPVALSLSCQLGVCSIRTCVIP